MYAVFSFSSTVNRMDYLATNFHHLIPCVVRDAGNNITAKLSENCWRVKFWVYMKGRASMSLLKDEIKSQTKLPLPAITTTVQSSD